MSFHHAYGVGVWTTAQLQAVEGADDLTKSRVSDEVFELVSSTVQVHQLWLRNWAREPPVRTVQEYLIAESTRAAAPAPAVSRGAGTATVPLPTSSAGRGGISTESFGPPPTNSSAARTGGSAQPASSPGVGPDGYISLSARGASGAGLNRKSKSATAEAKGSGKRRRVAGQEEDGGGGGDAGSSCTDGGGGGGSGGKKSAKSAVDLAKAAARKQVWSASGSGGGEGGGGEYSMDLGACRTTTSGSWGGIVEGGHGLRGGEGDDGEEIDWTRVEAIVGTCMAVEKRYLRLIAPPEACDVRPQPVLEQALEHVKARYAGGERYRMYVWEQLKSIRQDLAVQHISNSFTVAVYEAHARIALENQDPEEYNKCQAQLSHLYASGLPGCRVEFLAYQCLYLSYSEDQHEAKRLLKDLSSGDRQLPWVAHAIAVRAAIAAHNWVRFFKLHRTTPNMGGYILDLMLHRTRTTTLAALVKGMAPVKPGIPLTWLTSVLRFDRPSECRAFVERCGGVLLSRQEDVGVEVGEAALSRPPSAAGVGARAVWYVDAKASDIKQVRETTTEEREFAQAGLKLLAAAKGGSAAAES